MKILIIAPYMTNNAVQLLSQCKAGFGYMVYDIAAGIAQQESVDAVLYNYRYKAFSTDSINFIECSFNKFICNILQSESIFKLWKIRKRYKMQCRTFIRMCYGWLISGYYRQIIKDGNYDVVHIHGCSLMNTFFIDICNDLHIPFIITLHGLNSFSESVKLEPAGKQYEKDFLKEALERKYNLTVISTGIKKKILDYFKASTSDNIHIVNNSFKLLISEEQESYDIRNRYSIPENAKILLYIGNISSNKNQAQMIEAYDQLPPKLKESVYVLFLGRDNEKGYSIEEFIKRSSYPDHLILCGNINKNMIYNFYRKADGVVLLSVTEGFGLSLIEGMHFGLPCLTFTDLDAFTDIYSEDAVVALPNRDNDTVVEGLKKLLNNEWDKDVIKEYSKKFEASTMVNNYISLYKSIL